MRTRNTSAAPAHRPDRRPLPFAVIGLIALVVTACGGDDPSAGPTPSSTLVDPTTTRVDPSPSTTAPAVSVPEVPPLGSGEVDLRLTRLVGGLDQPVAMATVPGTSRLLLVERAGRVLDATLVADELVVDPDPVLDLGARLIRDGGEQGLLGIAVSADATTVVLNGTFLDPDDADSEGGISQLLRYDLVDGVIDPATETVILRQPQPYWNHNGGHVAFGPDGMLYAGFGDGGSQDDPHGNGQRTDTLLSTIVRIDARASTAERVAVPSDNPFVGVDGARAEIWSVGLRNPWRFAFDPAGGDLWIGDVGGDLLEEIDLVRGADGAGRGVNFGWQLREGDVDTGTRGERSDLVDPVLTLAHEDGYCSVIGGIVARDPRLPELAGSYLFTDVCRGELHVLTGERLRLHPEERTWSVTTFAAGPAGEVLVATHDGQVFRIDPR